MKRIVLDTNTLMAIGQFKIDVFSEIDTVCDFSYELRILDKTIDELEKIKNSDKGKQRHAAKLALSIIRAKGIKIIRSGPGHVDDLLVKLSEKGAIIVTQDKELKERLHKPYITIRQKKKVVEVE